MSIKALDEARRRYVPEDTCSIDACDLACDAFLAGAEWQAIHIAVAIEAAIEAHKDYIAAMAGVPRKEVARDSMVENGMRRCARIAWGES